MMASDSMMTSAAGEFAQGQMLAEPQRAADHRRHRQQQRHQHRVGGAGNGEHAEIGNRGQRRSEDTDQHHGRRRFRRRWRQHPRLIDEEGEGMMTIMPLVMIEAAMTSGGNPEKRLA